MRQQVANLIEAIDRKDAGGIRAAYAPAARLVTMTPNTFEVHEGVDAVAAKLIDWYTTWEETPAYSFLDATEDGERTVVEFERTSMFEGAPWVVRQAHAITTGPAGITEHRIYCCGPREGQPELGPVYAEGRR